MKRYSVYKESDAKWAGNIPKSWECLRFKDLSVVNRGASPRPIDDPKYFDDEGDYSWVRIADLSASERYLLATKQRLSLLGASLSVKRYPGDFFLSIAGTVGKPIITKIKCCIHDGFVWFPNLKIDSEFLYYLCSTGTPYQGLGKLGTQLNLNTETVGNIFIPVPSKKEIEHIVHYLDTETGKIDQKIAGLEKKTLLYKELKQSIINETVTRGLPAKEAQAAGLTPNPPLKDSGIPWIGEIPEHWDERRKVDIVTNNKRKNTTVSERNLLSLSYGTIKRKNYETSFGLLPASFSGYQIVKKGNIILRLTDLQNDQRSLRVGLVKDDKGIITSAYIGLVFKKDLIPTYFYYLIHYYDIAKVFYWQGGGLRQSMTFDDVKILPVIIPPQKEQLAIANYLDRKTTHIDKITATITEQITTLKELRKTLINDVVTGKICVTDDKLTK